MSGVDNRRTINTQLQATGSQTPLGSSHTRIYEGGTTWSVIAVAAAVLGSLRLWTLIPIAMERFAFGSCRPASAYAQLTWPQIAIVVSAGLVGVVLAEFGVRRRGNRWLSMTGSVVGVFCMLGGACLIFVLSTPPLPCTP